MYMDVLYADFAGAKISYIPIFIFTHSGGRLARRKILGVKSA